jgi:hypothetical protein
MLFRVLYGLDLSITQFYVAQSMKRLGAEWTLRDFEPDLARVLFFLLLDRDMVLKQAALDGLPKHCIDPLPARKAESFFLALREEVIEPWLSKETLGVDVFVDMVTNLYLVV